MYIKKIAQTIVLIVVLLIFNNININAGETEEIIRVACILDNGYYIMEQNGGLSGYSYDFLMMLSQHTDWKYEFVMIDEGDFEKSKQKAIDLLINGEIDLLGSITQDDYTQEIFEFPTAPAGISRHTLVSLVGNNKINRNNYFIQDKLKIALVEDDVINKEYLSIVDGRGFENDITYVKNCDDTLDLLKNGEVDIIIVNDSTVQNSQLNYLTTIDRTPFYFVSYKGNIELIEKLDKAINKIYIEEPNLSERLFDDYFATVFDGNITLSKEEELALKDYEYFNVGLLKNREPYQFYDETLDIPSGISVEILEEISNITGIKFVYNWYDTRKELADSIENKEIDIISTVPFDPDYELTSFFNVVITQPYVTNTMIWLHNKNETENATPYFYYISENIPFYPDEELIETLNFENKLVELSKNGNISMFADSYMAQYYIQKLGVTNIEMQTINSVNSKICFGVGKHLESEIVGLINQSLLHIDPFLVDEIVYNNVTGDAKLTLEAFWLRYYFEIFFVVLTLFVAIFFLFYFYSKKLKELSRRDGLSKLYNAGYFHKYTEKKAKFLKQGCLILVDIDLFKQINDTQGHQFGDEVIVNVAQNLKKNFRKNDVVARLGGDEFIIFLEDTIDIGDIQNRCQSILDNLAPNNVTLSIGGYFFNQQTDYKDLYNLADSTLYKVKENGRNGYLFSSNEDKDKD